MFERAEYLDRVARAENLVVDLHLDAIIVLDFANLHWLTGLDGETAYLTQIALIRPGDIEPHIWVREQDWNGARHDVFMNESKIHYYPERFVGGELHPFDYIGAAIADLGLGAARIGIEMSDSHYTVPAAARLNKTLPSAKMVDIGDAVECLRWRKSAAEIVHMRDAAKLADRTMEAAIDSINDGVREAHVAGVIAATRLAGLTEFAGGWPGAFSYMPSGTRTNTPHSPWGDGTLRNGMGVNLEIGAARHRYVAALSRTVHLGPPPESLVRLHQATLDGMDAVFGFARPGVTCDEVAKVFQEAIHIHAETKNSRIGYGIGVDWMEASLSLQAGNRTELQSGMTFHLMLGMWREHDGYVLSETFLVTENGNETLSKTPRRLFLK